MLRVRAGLVGMALTSVTIAAAAQRKVDNIGNGGGIVIGAERLAGVYHTKDETQTETDSVSGFTSTIDQETSITTFAVFGHNPGAPTEIPRLALDYFVIDGFSLGGSFMFMRTNLEGKGEQRISGGGSTQSADLPDERATLQAVVFHPRIGYAVAFNEYVGIWPRAGLSYTHVKQTQKVTIVDPSAGNQDVEVKTTLTFTNLTLEGLLFVSPFSNFAFVGGPFADLGLGGSTKTESTQPNALDSDGDYKTTSYGFIVGLAGYFDTR